MSIEPVSAIVGAAVGKVSGDIVDETGQGIRKTVDGVPSEPAISDAVGLLGYIAGLLDEHFNTAPHEERFRDRYVVLNNTDGFVVPNCNYNNQFLYTNEDRDVSIVTGTQALPQRLVGGKWNPIAYPAGTLIRSLEGDFVALHRMSNESFATIENDVPGSTTARTLLYANDVATDTTGTKLEYTVTSASGARLVDVSWVNNTGSPTVQLQIIRAGTTIVVSGAMSGLRNISLQNGDIVRWVVTTAAAAGSTADATLSVSD